MVSLISNRSFCVGDLLTRPRIRVMTPAARLPSLTMRPKAWRASSRSGCVFRGKAATVPKSSRPPFRNEAGHNSGMKPVTDSDFKPASFRRWSEPWPGSFRNDSTGRKALDNDASNGVPLESGGTHIANEKVVHAKAERSPATPIRAGTGAAADRPQLLDRTRNDL